MCGFVGGLLRGTLEPKRLDRALETLHHRGPDGVGKWVAPDGRWFLGHTRLSIIGLDNGEQPMSDASGEGFKMPATLNHWPPSQSASSSACLAAAGPCRRWWPSATPRGSH